MNDRKVLVTMGLLIPTPEAVAVSSNPNYSGDPEPGKVLGEVVRVRERIRARRWWYVAESLVMASSLTVFYVAIHSWPDLVAAWLLAAAVVVTGLLALMQRHRRSVPTPARKWEGRAMLLSFGLVLVCLPVYRFLLPDGFSLWLVLAGLLPGLPFAVLAWRVSRS